MDQNSLPMVPDLDAFPRAVRLLVVWGSILVVGFFALVVLLGAFGVLGV